MKGMFENAPSFNNGCEENSFDCPLQWKTTGSVINVAKMFWGAWRFNQKMNGLDFSQVTTMEEMFSHASDFNNGCEENSFDCPLSWDTIAVTTMAGMFQAAREFNQ